MNKLLSLKLDFIPKQAVNPFIKAKQHVLAHEAVPTLAAAKKIIPTRKVFQNNVPVMNTAPIADEAVIGGVIKTRPEIKSAKKGKAHFQHSKKEVLNSYFDNEKLIDSRQENLEEMVNDIVAKDRAKAKAQAQEQYKVVKAYEKDALSYFDEDDFNYIVKY